MGEVAQINRFLGINEDVDTQLQLGEASSMVNYRVTQNYKLKQVEGYEKIVTSIAAKDIQGQWYGKIGATYFHLVACNGHLHKIIAGTPTDLGTLADAPTFMFQNQSKVYIMDGTNYKSFDGTTLADVTGYVPTVMTSTTPAGDGTALEDINLLTGQKIQKFNADGAAAIYQLMETAVDSIDEVKYNGVVQTLTTHYTVNLTNGTVTPVTPASWATGENNVVIKWTKASAANRAEVTGCRRAVNFGTRIHIWGNTTYKNRRWHGGLVNAITSAEYFPATQVTNIGPDEMGISDIVTQYDRQVILMDGGRAYYSYYQNVDDVIAFPVFELNETTGNQAFGQAQVLDNFPISIQDGVYRWTSTGVRDERNAAHISQRVQKTLDTFTLSAVQTYDWERMRELWIAHGKDVVIYNYQADVWYKLALNDTIKTMIVIDGDMYFGTANGEIMKFDSATFQFNGVAISAEWVSGYFDWGAEWRRKFVNYIYITMEPAPKANLDVYWITDRDDAEKQTSYSIGYNTFVYSQANYGTWTYNTNYSPRPKRVRTKAKKFAYYKLILRNSKNLNTSSVLGITFEARVGGDVK